VPCRTLLACAVTLALLALPVAAAGGSSSTGGMSTGGGAAKSSSKSGFSSAKKGPGASKSGTSKTGSRSSKGGKSKTTSKAVTVGGAGAPLTSAPVREDGSPATDIRFRGAYFAEATFAKLPCERVEISVGERRCWRCGNSWFEKVIYDGQPGYVEVFAPWGARTDRLPEHVEAIRGESTTYLAADDAIYTPVEDGSGDFVVVSTSPGFRVEELPEATMHSVPIVANGATYYRYLGVYYREVHEEGRIYYVASEDPF
jgi:hypothetical protein